MGTCKVDECERASRCLELCPMHFRRYQRHGDPTVTKRPELVKDRPATCTVDGCEKPHEARGWCWACHTALDDDHRR